MKNTIKRTVCLMLCLCMAIGTATMLSSCNNTEEAPTETADPNEGKVSVVRALTVLEAGSKIERKNFQEVMVDSDSVPEGAYATIKEVANKFLRVKLYPGDILMPDKVAKNSEDTSDGDDSAAEYEEYVLVTEYTDGVLGDLSDAIQKAIDENPNKTIYFPEGKYNVKKTIKTSADPAKCVSLRLATHATIIAAGTDWEDGQAVIELGGKDDVKSLDANTYFIGGIIQTDEKCNGLTVAGGNVLINNISIKGAKIGIVIKDGARADVDSVVITGDATVNAIGVLMEGEESTLTNMRIARITYGVKLTGSNNVLRNVHPLGGRTNMIESTGFWDLSEGGNFYDICYSDQFANSFRLGPNVTSIFSGCYGFWYDGSEGNHYGFLAEGPFASISINTRIYLSDKHKELCDLSYIQAKESGGNGVIVYPRLPGHKSAEDTPDEHYGQAGSLSDYVTTDIMS